MSSMISQPIKNKLSRTIRLILAPILSVFIINSILLPQALEASEGSSATGGEQQCSIHKCSAETANYRELFSTRLAYKPSPRLFSRQMLRKIGLGLLLATGLAGPAIGNQVGLQQGTPVISTSGINPFAATHAIPSDAQRAIAVAAPVNATNWETLALQQADDGPLYSRRESDNHEKFEDFKATYDKQYESADVERQRYKIFVDALKRADQMNDAYHREFGLRPYGITTYSDMEPSEFVKNILTARSFTVQDKLLATDLPLGDDPVPDRVEWRHALTPIKQQGACGSCWAFSTVADVETRTFFKNATLPVFSTQQVVSCDKQNYGCGGGWPQKALAYMSDKGLQLQGSYEYTSGHDGLTKECSYAQRQVRALVTNFMRVGTQCSGAGCADQEVNLQKFVAQYGPVNVLINGTPLQSYRGGIMEGDCPNGLGNMNHAVQLVGFGVQIDGKKYWLIRNSWGTGWGEQGFARLQFGVNKCGIINDVYFVGGVYYGPDAYKRLKDYAPGPGPEPEPDPTNSSLLHQPTMTPFLVLALLPLAML